MLARSVDPATGIIHVLASGEWDDDKIDEHFHKMRPLLAERRAAGMPIMVLIDVRDAPRPSDATRLKLKAGAASTYKLGDRVVLVALDATMKDDVRNFLVGEGVWSYCSMIAAEQWLLMQTDLGRVRATRRHPPLHLDGRHRVRMGPEGGHRGRLILHQITVA